MTIERQFFKNAAAAAAEAVYVEDVFSAYLYTGDNSASKQIQNGINLSSKGGLIWIKARTAAQNNNLIDTARGIDQILFSNTTASQGLQTSPYGVTAVGTDGFTLGYDISGTNAFNVLTASWTFRKQPKFFDIVTYTGTGSARTISHALGSTPGMIIVKRTDTTGNWQVYHRSLTSAANSIQLNLTNVQASAPTVWNSTAPTSSVFSVGTDATVNASGGTYVAYLFAHDAGGFGAAGTDSIVSCGLATTDATGLATINLGWEPQFTLVKKVDGSSQDWYMFDTMRGMPVDGREGEYLIPNLTAAAGLTPFQTPPTSNGFLLQLSASSSYIYLAIRRGPMKTPTDSTKVFAPINSNTVYDTFQTTNFPIDTQFMRKRASTNNMIVVDKMRGVSSNTTQNSGPFLATTLTGAEQTTEGTSLGWENLGYRTPGYVAGAQSIFYNLRRAPGFFDVVCYTGTGSLTGVSHNLGATPELKIIKRRSAAGDWVVGGSLLGASQYMFVNTTAAAVSSSNYWNGGTDSSTAFSVRTGNAGSDASGSTYVAYLFATCPGVSKVGSYTGTGSTQTINCGFTNGARFVLIKRTDSTGDWYVWDSARGIVAGNDPYLLLNSTAAEVTNTDYVDTDSVGFQISSTAPAAINASGGSFIFLAIA